MRIFLIVVMLAFMSPAKAQFLNMETGESIDAEKGDKLDHEPKQRKFVCFEIYQRGRKIYLRCTEERG